MTYRHLSLQEMGKLMSPVLIQYLRTLPLQIAREMAIRQLKKDGYKTVAMAVKAIEELSKEK